LLGPPIVNAEIAFIGYQPGFGVNNWTAEACRKQGYENRWPSKSEFVTQSWKLALNLQRMFGCDFLAKCVGLNAIFVRSKNIEKYEAYVCPSTRAEIEKFCLP